MVQFKIKLPKWNRKKPKLSRNFKELDDNLDPFYYAMQKSLMKRYGYASDVLKHSFVLSILGGLLAGYIYSSMGGSFFLAFLIEIPIGFLVAVRILNSRSTPWGI